ncbi:MAG: hypothetical protein CSA47_00060, partial [Gammaproteobacteria bacterium]
MPTDKKNRFRRVLRLGALCILIAVLVLGFAFPTLISSPPAIPDKSANGTSSYYSGYIEGNYRFIAAPSSGWLTTMPWQAGDYLSAKTLAFTMEDELQALAVDKAQAQVDAAMGQLIDLQSGKRDAVLNKLKAQREV